VTDQQLLALCNDLCARARKAGATAAEAIATWERSVEAGLENNEIHSVEAKDEATFGLRVLVGRSLGFITANRSEPEVLARLIAEAIAQARATPEDPFNDLAAPQRVQAVAGLYDERTANADVEDVTRAAGVMLEIVRAGDARVRVDSGSVTASASATALVSTSGIELVQRESGASGYLFGMAVDGEDVASFDYDGDSVRAIGTLDERLHRAAKRFVEKCLSGLRAEKGKSFRGPIVLSPEAVGEFLLPNLISSMGADAVRKGRSLLVDKLGKEVASTLFTLVDDGTHAGGVASSAFDREGTPVTRRVLVDAGVLQTFLYNHYEARAAGVERSTGHAAGSASSLPAIGPHRLEVGAGTSAMAELTAGAGPLIWVGRFSGSSNPVTGEFSGVVKNGYLWENGSKRPVRETLIAGNLFESLKRIDAVSRERQEIEGTRLLPAIRIDGVSITAG